MTLRYWFSALTLFFASALFADNAKCWSALRERFPELNLPESQPTFRTATSYDTLKAAISAAISASGDDVILLDGRNNQTWVGSSTIEITGSAANGSIFIVSQNPETGDFNTPVTFKGFGIYLKSGNTLSLKLANLTIEGANTLITSDFSHFSPGIMVNGGTLIASCITLTSAEISLGVRAFGISTCVSQGEATYYNSIFANNNSASYYTQSVAHQMGGSLSFYHCTFKNNKTNNSTITTSTTNGNNITMTNCLLDASPSGVSQGYLVSNEISNLISTSTTIPYCEGPGIETDTKVDNLTYDALGNDRNARGKADYGAVEAIELALPEEFVILPSGTRQIYIGWEPISIGTLFLETRANESDPWTRIPSTDLIYSPTEGNNAPLSGWKSFRYYVKDSAFRQAYYRLVATDGQTTLMTDSQKITLQDVPQYSSRPQSTKTIYLDFGGYIFDAQKHLKKAQSMIPTFNDKYICTTPFKYEGGPGYYSNLPNPCPTEYAIYDIWRMVSEDFSIFDVNVTTIEPHPDALSKTDPADDTYGVRVVIGFATIGTWVDAGGLAEWNSFNASIDDPAFVFGNTSRQNAACQITHEVSHTLGLHHDSGNPFFMDSFIGKKEYYFGVDVVLGATWYPVMGSAPSSTGSSNTSLRYEQYDFINQWSKGDYTQAYDEYRTIHDEPEDDFAIMLGLWEGKLFTNNNAYAYKDYGLRLIEDDFSDIFEQSTLLPLENNKSSIIGLISKHIDETTKTTYNDVDCFKITTSKPALLSIDVTPGYYDSYTPYNSINFAEGASLNAKVEVYAADGQTILAQTDKSSSLYDFRNANLELKLSSAGTYLIRVSGTFTETTAPSNTRPNGYENVETWYLNDPSSYGSIGPYRLDVKITPIAKPGYQFLIR